MSFAVFFMNFSTIRGDGTTPQMPLTVNVKYNRKVLEWSRFHVGFNRCLGMEI